MLNWAKFVLAGNRMVNAQSYLSKPKSGENSSTNIFIEKTKTGNRGTPGRRICQILTTICCMVIARRGYLEISARGEVLK